MEAFCQSLETRNDIRLHCFFQSGSEEYEEVIYDLELSEEEGASEKVTRVMQEQGEDLTPSFTKFDFVFYPEKVVMTVERNTDLMAGGDSDNIQTGTYTLFASDWMPDTSATMEKQDILAPYQSVELAAMARAYYLKENHFLAPEVECVKNDDGTTTIHLYEIVEDDEKVSHTGTSAWYTVDGYGKGKDDVMGNTVEFPAMSLGEIAQYVKTPIALTYSEEGEQTASSTAASIEDSWTVVPLASAQELVPYSCTEFSMNIPEGWSVKSSAMYTGMFHAIHVFDPENPVNQIFFMLKMEPLFSDENSRAMMALSSDLFGKYPILTNVSTQGVFEIFPQFADAMNATADYADIQTPYIADFSVTESFESTQGMSSVAISPSILRADFTQNGTTGEGMFTADVVPFAMGTGYYSVYNLTVLSAEKGTFQDWQPTLNKVLSSLNYTPEFQSFAMSQSNQAASTSQSLSQSASEMSDSIMSSWENRNRSQDIMSQKQSDATLGYERIVDTETGNIYKIDNGFTDWYDGSRYKSITDDQYTDSVEAVIHWK